MDGAIADTALLPRERPTLDSRIVRLDRGSVDARHLIGQPQDGLGILILDGLIVAGLEAGRAHAAWLIGADDLLRPWEMDQVSLICDAQWRVLTPARVLRLDASLPLRLRHDPRVVRELLSRAVRTSHWLFAKSVVISSPSIEERLILLFGLWAERWGKVTPDGIWVDLPLTHALIGELCGARRPTVSLALGSLEKQGLLTRSSRSGWLLHDTPEADARRSRWTQHATTLEAALGDGAAAQNGHVS